MVLNLDSENKVSKNSIDIKDKQTTKLLKQVKDKVSSTLEFDDIEFITFLHGNINKITIDKTTGKVDLSKFVFDVIKKYLKNKFEEYIKHPSFLNIIKKELSLIGDYKIFFDKSKRKFELINITDDRRFKGIKAEDVNILIDNILNLKNEEDIEVFLNKIIYGVDISVEEYIGEGFNDYIYGLIYNKIKSITDKKNYTINLSGDTLKDKNTIFSKAMACKIYRDNFEYTNSIAGHKLLSNITEVILGEILSGDNRNFEEPINTKIIDTIRYIDQIKKTNNSDIEFLENTLNNDELIIFQEKIKLYFEKFYNTTINDKLLIGSINYLITNNNLNINISDLIESIFSLIDNNIDVLIEIFSKYNNTTIKENGSEYFYENFNIRYLNKLEGGYNTEKIFKYIKKVLEKKERIITLLEIKSKKLKVSEFQQYHYNGTINKGKELVKKLEDKLETVSILLKNKELEIQNLESKKGLFQAGSERQKKLEKLDSEKRELINKTVKTMKELDAQIIKNGSLYSTLYKDIISLNAEVEDLKILEIQIIARYNRLIEDFTRTLLFGRKKIDNKKA